MFVNKNIFQVLKAESHYGKNTVDVLRIYVNGKHYNCHLIFYSLFTSLLNLNQKFEIKVYNYPKNQAPKPPVTTFCQRQIFLIKIENTQVIRTF